MLTIMLLNILIIMIILSLQLYQSHLSIKHYLHALLHLIQETFFFKFHRYFYPRIA